MKTRTLLAGICTGIVFTLSVPAFAQDLEDECQTDADCADDFVCETIGWGACPSCVPDEECPPCETGEQNICVPPPPKQCDAANPCDGDDVCVTYTFESCSGGTTTEDRPACDPDDSSCEPSPSDPPEEPAECETTTESYCVPPYLAPCQEDADCGGGFTCEAVEVCVCSGGAAVPCSSEDPDCSMSDPAPPPEGECSCDPTGENYCRLIEVECDSDADCADGLTCQDLYGGERPAIACVAPDGEEPVDCPEPEPVDPVSYCAPADYYYYGGGVDSGGGYGESVAQATGRDDATVTNSEREEFFPVDGTDGDGGSKQSPSSCSTASGGSGGSLLLLLAGLALGRRRRRS